MDPDRTGAPVRRPDHDVPGVANRHARPVGPIEQRLAGAPISWGVCEVPGWGPMLAPERVLAEMGEVGLRGTELGAEGFLPRDAAGLTRVLKRYELALVGGFVALALADERPDRALATAREAAELLADVGGGNGGHGGNGGMLVLAVVQDEDWSPPQPLDDAGWSRLAENVQELRTLVSGYGLTVALHPHVGTLIETSEQVERALAVLDVDWCLDTGHLFIGGVDPAAFARSYGDRVAHVHLKDVDARVAAELRAGRASLLTATRQGLFLPLGEGDAPIGDVLDALRAHDYDGWFVLEQDTALTGDGPAVGSGARRDALTSVAFLHQSAHINEEVTP